MTPSRIQALVAKELLDARRNFAALLPVVLVTGLTLAMTFGIAFFIPFVTGHRLAEDMDLVSLSAVTGVHDELSNDGRIQLFLFQQFLVLFLVTPITGAMPIQTPWPVRGQRRSGKTTSNRHGRPAFPALYRPPGT